MEQPTTDGERRFGEKVTDEWVEAYFWKFYASSKAKFTPVKKDGEKFWKEYGSSAEPGAVQPGYTESDDRILFNPPLATGIVNTILGTELGARREPKFEGQDGGPLDQAVAGWLTKVCRFCRQKTKAHRIDQSAALESFITGYGYSMVYVDTDRRPILPMERRLPFRNVWEDPYSVEEGHEDREAIAVEWTWPLERLQARFPDRASEIANLTNDRESSRLPTASFKQDTRSSVASAGRQRSDDVASLFDFQFRRWELWHRFVNPLTGREDTLHEEDFDALKRQLDEEADAADEQYRIALAAYEADAALGAPPAPPPEPPQMPRIEEDDPFYQGTWYRAELIAAIGGVKGIVLKVERTNPNQCLFLNITGFKRGSCDVDDSTAGRFVGAMQMIYDVQVFISKLMSTYLEIMARAVKGGVLFPRSAIGDRNEETVMREASKPGFSMVLESTEGVMPLNPQPIPSEFPNSVRMLIEMFGRILGVNEWLQGNAHRAADASHILATSLQEQGLTMMLPIREPITAYLVESGQKMAALALKHLPVADLDRIVGDEPIEGVTHERDEMTGELVPILGEDGEPLTPGKILKEVDPQDFDVVADVEAAAATMRQAAWRFWGDQGFFEQMSTLVPPEILVPPVLRAAPLPGTDVAKLVGEVEKYFLEQQKAGTAQGLMEQFGQMAVQDPQGAAELMANLHQMLQQPAPPAAA